MRKEGHTVTGLNLSFEIPMHPPTELLDVIKEFFSQYNVTDMSAFQTNVNASFADLRAKLDAGELFATEQQLRGSSPVYAMIQCRRYPVPS
ncbi:hypothetical protein LWI28_020706 [Acer negundo]|uniref:Uncharacterized protein n=1 Tax=Acer negundo TaxID=4023 RepID=A0AAD5IFK6_ACENE|nr:hypothetical protein LWI28_020706 [Acer negundo]